MKILTKLLIFLSLSYSVNAISSQNNIFQLKLWASKDDSGFLRIHNESSTPQARNPLIPETSIIEEETQTWSESSDIAIEIIPSKSSYSTNDEIKYSWVVTGADYVNLVDAHSYYDEDITMLSSTDDLLWSPWQMPAYSIEVTINAYNLVDRTKKSKTITLKNKTNPSLEDEVIALSQPEVSLDEENLSAEIIIENTTPTPIYVAIEVYNNGNPNMADNKTLNINNIENIDNNYPPTTETPMVEIAAGSYESINFSVDESDLPIGKDKIYNIFIFAYDTPEDYFDEEEPLARTIISVVAVAKGTVLETTPVLDISSPVENVIIQEEATAYVNSGVLDVSLTPQSFTLPKRGYQDFTVTNTGTKELDYELQFGTETDERAIIDANIEVGFSPNTSLTGRDGCAYKSSVIPNDGTKLPGVYHHNSVGTLQPGESATIRYSSDWAIPEYAPGYFGDGTWSLLSHDFWQWGTGAWSQYNFAAYPTFHPCAKEISVNFNAYANDTSGDNKFINFNIKRDFNSELKWLNDIVEFLQPMSKTKDGNKHKLNKVNSKSIGFGAYPGFDDITSLKLDTPDESWSCQIVNHDTKPMIVLPFRINNYNNKTISVDASITNNLAKDSEHVTTYIEENFSISANSLITHFLSIEIDKEYEQVKDPTNNISLTATFEGAFLSNNIKEKISVDISFDLDGTIKGECYYASDFLSSVSVDYDY